MKCAAGLAVATLSAMVLAADARLEKKQATTPYNTESALLVLATALPSSLLSEAITNSNAVSSEIASEFAAGSTPSWFSALPTDIKSHLLQQGANSTSGSLPASATPPRVSATGVMPYGTNSTNGTYMSGSGAGTGVGTVTSTSVSVTSSGSSSGSTSGGSGSGSGSSGSGSGSSGASSSSRSSAGANAMPTAAIGAGFGMAVGFIGMLAL